jgi:hypothetical protein
MPLVRLLQETPGRKKGAEYLHTVGEVVNVDDDLARYWRTEGRAEYVKDIPAVDPMPETTGSGAPLDVDYPSMTVVQLRELAKDAGIPYSGKNKAALIAALEKIDD